MKSLWSFAPEPSLSSMSGGISYQGVIFNNENNNGELDVRDTFLLDRTMFPDGFRMTIFGNDHVQYYVLAWFYAH